MSLTDARREHFQILINHLDQEGCLELIAMVEARLAELQEEQEIQEPLETSSQDKMGGSGWIELKMIQGFGPYAYKRWRQGGRLRSQYVGKVKQEENA